MDTVEWGDVTQQAQATLKTGNWGDVTEQAQAGVHGYYRHWGVVSYSAQH